MNKTEIKAMLFAMFTIICFVSVMIGLAITQDTECLIVMLFPLTLGVIWNGDL